MITLIPEVFLLFPEFDHLKLHQNRTGGELAKPGSGVSDAGSECSDCRELENSPGFQEMPESFLVLAVKAFSKCCGQLFGGRATGLSGY